MLTLDPNVKHDAEQTKQIVPVAVRILLEATYIIPDTIILALTDLAAVDGTGRMPEQSVTQILFDEAAYKRIARALAPKLYTSRKSSSKAMDAWLSSARVYSRIKRVSSVPVSDNRI